MLRQTLAKHTRDRSERHYRLHLISHQSGPLPYYNRSRLGRSIKRFVAQPISYRFTRIASFAMRHPGLASRPPAALAVPASSTGTRRPRQSSERFTAPRLWMSWSLLLVDKPQCSIFFDALINRLWKIHVSMPFVRFRFSWASFVLLLLVSHSNPVDSTRTCRHTEAAAIL